MDDDKSSINPSNENEPKSENKNKDAKFCKTCNKFICPECSLNENHNGHITINVNESSIKTLNSNELKSVPSLKRECDCCESCSCCNSCGEEVLYAITLVGRLIMTFYSFHALFFIYNFIIQFIMLIPEILYSTDYVFLQAIIIIVYLFFAILASNILIIPTYEFLLFSFLRYRNVLAHVQSLRITMNIINKNDKDDEKIEFKKSNYWIDSFLIIIEIAYIIGFFLGFSSGTIKGKDIIRLIILIIIYFYYLIIFFGYVIISIYLITSLIRFIWKKTSFFKEFFFYLDKNIDEFFFEKEPLPQINLFSYIINPLLIRKSYENAKHLLENDDSCFTCDRCFYDSKNIAKCIVFFFSLIIALIVTIIQKAALTAIFCFFFFIFMLILLLMMNFPFFCRNKKTFGEFFSPINYYRKEYKMEHPRIVSFIRFICFLVILIIYILIIFSFIFFKDKGGLDKIKNTTLTPSTIGSNSNSLLPNICFSSIHNLNINLFLPFINDAYYYDDYPKESTDYRSSLEISNYKNLFFDSNYAITVGRNLVPVKNGKDSVKMIKYDIQKNTDEITILSIKGTSNKKDAYLDLQLYFPSVLLNLLSIFSVFSQQKDTYTFRFMEYSLSIPYRIFSQYLIIDEYLEDLLKAYNDNKSSFKSNVVIVGHSLGGGLAKILGRVTGKQAISLSGPGVNAFHSLWDYEGSSENFEISAIDLVPDMDLVPRVEVSGGTIYRIVCKEGPFDCHSSELSLCEVLIMCKSPNYQEYCKKVKGLSDREIKAILKSVKLN